MKSSEAAQKILVLLGRVKRMSDLRDINTQIGVRWRQVQGQASEKVIGDLHIGQKVSFKGRRGLKLVGKIRKINQKTVSVDCGADGRWRVTASMVKPI